MRTETKAQRVRTGHFLPFGSPTSIPQFPLFRPPSPAPHFGVCAPRKTKVVKVTKQSFQRMPIPKLPWLCGVHFVEAEVQSAEASAAPPFP